MIRLDYDFSPSTEGVPVSGQDPFSPSLSPSDSDLRVETVNVRSLVKWREWSQKK